MNRLNSINITNYKCFDKVSFNIKDINIMIGENNAGKSTVVETIKLLSFAIEKLKNGNLIECPNEISENKRDRCVKLNIENLIIDISLVGHKYSELPSRIVGYFEGDLTVEVYIIKGEVYAIAYHHQISITNRKSIKEARLPAIYVMPHFNLLRDSEILISEKSIKRDRFNYRSSLHFRNELYEYSDRISELNELLNNTWNRLYVTVSYKVGESTYINTQIRDNDFSAEIKDYGSGLQMWLQILWFLCKIPEFECIVVLDEPDVYIHADLQRKLYYLVSDRFSQIIIATHSIEIINEAKLSDILIVDKRKNSFSFCKERTILDAALKSIGTTQNLMLTKLQRHNKCLFVEGTELDILDDFFKIAINDASKSIKDFATSKLDGKNNYNESFGAAKIFKEDSGGTFKTFCILDRDYNESFNLKIRQEAEQSGITLYILDRLEIENYLLVPRIYAEILGKPISEIEEKIKSIAETLKGDTFDRILEAKVLEYKKINPRLDLAHISKETREFIDSCWISLDNILSIVPGKEMRSKIYKWMKDEYNISCSDKKVLKHMTKTDIPNDLIEFLKEMNR